VLGLDWASQTPLSGHLSLVRIVVPIGFLGFAKVVTFLYLRPPVSGQSQHANKLITEGPVRRFTATHTDLPDSLASCLHKQTQAPGPKAPGYWTRGLFALESA
jgi:hypothetical protein